MLSCPNCGRESPEDFVFCPACAAPLAPRTPAHEIRKVVTVVFCDVTGSTALGEKIDPESLRDVQSRYFNAMRRAIERHGGTVEKYIGDAVLAVFGIPQLHEDDALRALRAAADMREALTILNKELKRDRGVTIAVRIGVNTGGVVAGDVTAGQAFVTGDAVNVAARLEQHAAPGEILLGDVTYSLARTAIEANSVEPLELKGKADRVPAWRLLRVREVVSGVPRRWHTLMVGREREFARLRRVFDSAVDEVACRLSTVIGSAGVGKSRLVEEFVSDLGAEAAILRGRCLPYGQGITYFPVVEAIKRAASLADFDPPSLIEAGIRSVLEGDEHKELVCRHVMQLMGAGEAMAREEIFWAIQRFFEACARERPLVLVFDDIHWGEPTFLDLLEHIAERSRGSPILLLAVARPDLLELRSAWGKSKVSAAILSLEPLSEEEAEELIANLLSWAELPTEVAERILRTADGNPLFLEETLAMLIDDGFLIRKDDQWVTAGALSAVTVPPSIHALLAARLDRLSPEERTVLEVAAVVGQEFSVGAVSELAFPDDGSRVSAHLQALIGKDLIRAERSASSDEDAFQFRHLLLRDAAYEAITKTARADLHERYASGLERTSGVAILEHEEIVAYHLEQAHAYRTQLGPADDRSESIALRASVRLASAGRRASNRGDFVACANLLRRALALGPPDRADRATLLYDLGNALEWVGDVAEAFHVFDDAVKLAAASDDRSLEWLARIRRSAMHMDVDPHGKPESELRAELEEAAAVFEEIGDEAGLATVWKELAAIDWSPCRFERAEHAARRAVNHARRSGDARLLADAISYLIAAQGFGTATPETGLRTLDELAEDVSRSRQLESFALVLRGFHRGMNGSVHEARRLITEALEIAESVGLRFSMAARERLGYVELCAGDAAAAERAFRRNYEILDEQGDEGHKSTTASSLGRVLCELGRYDEAERYAAIARDFAAEDDVASQVHGRSTQALVLAARREIAEAERLAREAVELYRDAEAPNYQGDIWMGLAKVLRVAGKSAEAERAAREALALFKRKENRLSSAAATDFIEQLRGSESARGTAAS
jgi:class 3 adenylate cyclase/tetratricopeptide (TPR) repeat protein